MFPFLKPAVVGVCLSWACTAVGDLYTLDGASPTLPGVPASAADILLDTPAPSIAVTLAALGLMPGDVVDAISDGFDPVFVPHLDYFSVTRLSVGAPGSGVAAEAMADTPPGVTPGHAADIFVAGLGLPAGTNILAPPGFGWTPPTTTGDEANAGLTNAPAGMGDNVNAYDLALAATAPIYFSLDPMSPSLGPLGATPDDVLAVGGAFGVVPVVFIDGVMGLGLPPGTDLDALALTVGPGMPIPVFLGPGSIEYSLTGVTAGLAGVSGADILGLAAGPPAPGIVHGFASIGLLMGDDLDALDVDQRAIPEPSAFLFGGLVCGVIGLVWCSHKIARILRR